LSTQGDRGAPALDLHNSHPCFGLDLGAIAFVRNQLIEWRNRGASVLLVSEDLDELLELADRILVMSAGRIMHDVDRATVDTNEIGRYMGGHALV